MLRIRPAQHHDLDGLMALSKKTGVGMTTVPKTERAMSHRIYLSQEAFARSKPLEKGETFFLVLEDDDKIIGMTCIFTKLGQDRPCYFYRLSQLSTHSPELDIRVDTGVLFLVNDFDGYTEVGTLFVDPDYRKSGIGRLLSFSRFMLMAASPGRFGDQVMAEIRGWTDADNRFPFWTHVSQKFFHMDFTEADKRSTHDIRFVADLMPKFPIYTVLLHEDAQKIIGKPHDTSKAAMELLKSQGFRYNNLLDIFDGGPSISADIDQIKTVQDAHKRKVMAGTPPQDGQKVLVCKNSLADFSCLQTMAKNAFGDTLSLTAEQMEELDITEGGEVLVAPLFGKKS